MSTYEGKSYTVTADTTILEYFDYILDFEPAEGQADYSEEARKLVVNTANYVYNGLVALGNDEKAELFKAYVDANPDRVNKFDKENLPKVDTSKIAKYVESITMHIDNYSPYVRFNLTDAGKAAKITLSTGAFQTSKNDYPTLGYIDTDRINMKSLNSLTITVTSAEGDETVKLTISILDYYTLLAEGGADEKTLNFVESMWAYAKADNEY